MVELYCCRLAEEERWARLKAAGRKADSTHILNHAKWYGPGGGGGGNGCWGKLNGEEEKEKII